MSYHRVCGGKDDGKPSETESQKRVEGELHNFLLKKKIFGSPAMYRQKKIQGDVSRFCPNINGSCRLMMN